MNVVLFLEVSTQTHVLRVYVNVVLFLEVSTQTHVLRVYANVVLFLEVPTQTLHITKCCLLSSFPNTIYRN